MGLGDKSSTSISASRFFGLSSGVAPVFRENDIVISSAGKSLGYTSLQSGKQNLVETSCTHEINVLNGNGNTLVYSCKAPKPVIFVQRRDQSVDEVRDPQQELEYGCLNISRDSKRLVAIGAQLEKLMTVFDLDTLEPIARLPAKQTYTHVTFSPLDNSLICASGPWGISFWHLVQGAHGIDLVSLGSEKSQGGYRAHCWSSDGKIVALSLDSSALVRLDPFANQTTEEGKQADEAKTNEKDFVVKYVNLKDQCGFGASSIQLIKQTFILGCDDGMIRWVRESNLSIVNGEKLGDDHTSITALAMEPNFDRCLALGSDGSQYIFGADPDSQIEAVRIASFHVGPVLGVIPIHSIRNSPGLVASVGRDGTFRIWDLARDSSCPIAQETILKTLDSSSVAASPDMNREKLASATSSAGNPFVAIGTESGLIKIVGICKAKTGEMEIVQVASIRAHESPVSLLKFDTSGKFLASGSSQDNTMCIFRIATTPPTMPGQRIATLAAVVEFKEDTLPLAFTWDKASLLVAAGNNGKEATLYRVQIPTSLADNETAKVVPHECGTLDNLRMNCIGNMSFLPNSGKLLASVSHRPQVVDVFQGAPFQRASATWTCPGHMSSIWSFAVLPDSNYFASGGADGSVCLWEDGENAELVLRKVVACQTPASTVTTICFAPDAKHLISGHSDGSLMISSITTKVGAKPVTYTSLESNQLHDASTKEDAAEKALKVQDVEVASLTESGKWRRQAQNILDQEYEKKRMERRTKISGLQKRLFQLLENNEQVPELEKLPRDEFVIDVNGKDSTTAENEKKAETLREKIEREIKGRELVFSRIKKECWESTEVHSREIHALNKDMKVRNFPVPKQTEDQKRQLARVVQLRTIELRELRAIQRNKQTKVWEERRLMKAIPNDVNYIVNAGLLEPTFDQSNNAETSNGEGGSSNNAAAGGGENAVTGGDASGPAEAEEGKGDIDDEDAEGGLEDDGDEKAAHVNNQSRSPVEEEEEDQAKEYTLLELLYHPASLRSGPQIRSQLILLKQVQREMMLAFNERFQKAVEEKEDTVEKVSSRYERINEILRELKMPEEPMPNYWSPSEDPHSIFEVTQDEIGVEKYLSKAEREQKAREEEERRRREAEAAKDDMGARALMDMMNGTLEAAKEQSLAERTLERPQWMTEIDYADMTDDQRKEYDDFEATYQKFMEEKEKYTKALELELKKIHAEVVDILNTFDESVETLYQSKVNSIEAITVQGLYITRLALKLFRQEDLTLKQSQVKERIASKRTELQEMSEGLNEFATKLDGQKAKLQELQELDKILERSFKTQVQELAVNVGNGEPLEYDTLKLYQQLFKFRGERQQQQRMERTTTLSQNAFDMFEKQGSNRSFGGSKRDIHQSNEEKEEEEKKNDEIIIPTLDPFAHLDQADEEQIALKEREKLLEPLSKERDCPEGMTIDDEIWEFIQQARLKKIHAELEVKAEAENVAALQSHFDELETRRSEMQQTVGNLEQEFQQIISARKMEGQNVEFIIRIKQGQDEVKPHAIITDYSNSLLLSRKAIERENEEIAGLGAAKVGIMRKMKDFRKSINYMQWEHKYMLQQERDFEEHYTDLHMLRVTRGLQEIIKGGEVNDRQDQTQQTEAKIAKMKKIHTAKMQKLNGSLKRLGDKTNALRSENESLDQRIKELRANVQMRDAVLQARSGTSVLNSPTEEDRIANRKRREKAPAGSGASAAKAKMKAIVNHRKLMDLARAQSDEIAFLKEELEQLRERNFPRFANPSANMAEKRFYKHPDYK